MAGERIPLREAAPKPAWHMIGLLGLFVLAALTILPTTIVALIAFLPAVVTLLVDESQGRYLARTVSGMATAATIPFIIKLWDTGHTVSGAVALASDVFTWFAIYAAVGIGWLMYLGLPSMVSQFREYTSQRRIAQLKEQQQELMAEWGEDIAGGAIEEAKGALAPKPSPPAPSAPH